MHILRSLGRAFLLLVITLSLGLFITLATLQATILNRDTVLGWLNESGAYNNFTTSVVQLQSSQENNKSDLLNQNALSESLGKTLSPEFIKESAETILNASYDWLEGKNDKIDFTIKVDHLRPVFQQQLALALEPEIAKLPTCTSSNFGGISRSTDIECIPQGSSAQALANDLARRAVESSDFLTQPLTDETFEQYNLPNAEPLKTVATNMTLILVLLPSLVLILGALFVLLSSNKLQGLKVLGRRIVWGTIVAVAAGAALWFFGPNISLGAFGDQTIIANVVDPIVRIVAAGVGMWLFIYSFAVLIVGGLIWAGAHLLAQRQAKQTSNADVPPTNLPPVNPPGM